MIGVISYQTGNARSVLRALAAIGAPARLVASPDDCDDIDRFVLPGVGAADVTMKSLEEAGWPDYLRARVVEGGAPFLGVCVGLQVLLDHSAEGDVDGLGWLSGEVREFPSSELRVPQMGWNSVDVKSTHPLLAGVPSDSYFYFVNSYFATVGDDDLLATTEYGAPFAAVIGRDNIMATQFHVEKSGPAGLAVLTNFVNFGKAA
ncbi:MAG: imidazole glycerol phosphate synthase, glutamine amidotransferase subunit [Glaciihabitans sp.]|nr:imidazole glycerol phosphate synthase, glutamine amidotransferase subunit [Glaciihabitans sp.]